MANITPYLRSRLVKQSLGIAPGTSWHAVTYAGLFVASPSISSGSLVAGTEVYATSTGYSRKQIYKTSSDGNPYWTGPDSDGKMSNTGSTPGTNDKISWTATANWNGTGTGSAVPIVAVGLFVSGTAGTDQTSDLLWYGPLSAPVTMQNGDTFSISGGSLVIALT